MLERSNALMGYVLTVYTLTLLRHGESAGNAGNIIQGQKDLPLTDRGRQQAQSLAARWQTCGGTFDNIISSPLIRARETAEIIAATLDLPVEFDADWKERGFGDLEGQEVEAIRRITPPVDFYHPFTPPGKGGESGIDVYLRANLAVGRLLHRPPGRYLVVSHGAILNMTLYAIFGITPQGHYNSPRFRFGNTAFANLSYNPPTRQWWLLSFTNPEDWVELGGLGTMDKV